MKQNKKFIFLTQKIHLKFVILFVIVSLIIFLTKKLNSRKLKYSLFIKA